MTRRRRSIVWFLAVLVLLAVSAYAANRQVSTLEGETPARMHTDDEKLEHFVRTIDGLHAADLEPSIRARRIANFDPETITVLDESDDGWVIIRTACGELWRYQRMDRYDPDQPLTYEAEGISRGINPQAISMAEEENCGYQNSAWLWAKRIGPDFMPPTEELDALLRRFGGSVSVYFENMDTGFVYRFNPYVFYTSASITKAPFSLYIYEKADEGETDLDSEHWSWAGGRLTQRELLRRNLMYSCNESTLTLRDIHGVTGYQAWITELGNNPAWVAPEIMGSGTNLEEAVRFIRAIYDYIGSDAAHGAEFKAHLLDNQFPFIVSDYPVASKTGWFEGFLHDIAIVYADSPYILVILSNGINRTIFEEISIAFQEFNDKWFVW